MRIEDRPAIQLDNKMIAFRSDPVLVPLVWFDLYRLSLRRANQASRVVPRRLVIPDLELVPGHMRLPLFLGAEENAAVHLFRTPKLERQLIVAERFRRPNPAGC